MRSIAFALCIVSLALAAHAAETDQFMTWNVDLEDSNEIVSN